MQMTTTCQFPLCQAGHPVPSPQSAALLNPAQKNTDHWIEKVQNWLETARVLEPGTPVTKRSHLPLYFNDFRYNHPRRFRKKLRVSPAVFDRLVELIEDDPVFHNNSNNRQFPVYIQLAIFLVRIGHYGNAASPENVAQWAGVSTGLVEKATYRCLVAFLRMHDDVVLLPTAEEKERAKEYVEWATCPEWRDGFLLADGTKFPFFQKPGLHGEAWFDKNKDYSSDAQIVATPHNLMIADYSLGHTGSVHDSLAFRSTRTYLEHERVFGPGEFMFADSAYPIETWSVAPFKKPRHRALTPDERTFNYWVSRVRIRVEHTIGLLKGRFQSLLELRINVHNNQHHLYTIMWCRACIILHNLVLRIEGDTIDTKWVSQLIDAGGGNIRHPVQEENDDDTVARAQRRQPTPGQQFRLKLMQDLFDSPYTDAVRRT